MADPFSQSAPTVAPNSPGQTPSVQPAGGGATPNMGTLELDSQGASQLLSDYNALDDYMDVIYHIRLSMVAWSDVQRLMRAGGTLPLNPEDTFTIASTGGVMERNYMVYETRADGSQTALHPFPYYALNKVTMTNLMSPTGKNPVISDLTTGLITMVQPYGFSLHKDLLYLAKDWAGYPEINPGRIIYKLDVWWSGFNQDTGEWTPRIPVLKTAGQMIDQITNYVLIANVEASPTHAGTQYNMTIQPYVAFAQHPSVITMDGVNVPTSAQTFGSFLDMLAQRMNESIRQQTNETLKYEYKFTAPKILRDATFDVRTLSDLTRMVNGSNDMKHFAKGTDVFLILHHALSDLPVAQNLYLADQNNDSYTTPQVRFTVRMKVNYNADSANRGINDFDRIQYEYIIEPFISFRSIPPLRENYYAVVSSEAQQQRLNAMINYQMILRKYDYFLTGQNTEVLDYQFKYNAFYYVALMHQPTNNPRQTPGLTGQPNNATPSGVQQQQQQQSTATTVKIINGFSLNSLQQKLQGIVGQPEAEVSPVTLSYQGQGRAPQAQGGTAQTNKERQVEYLTHMDWALNQDMMALDHLVVRGDPLWLITPYTNGVEGGLSFFKVVGDADIHSKSGRIILLRALAPEQNTYMSPDTLFKPKESTVLGGFYEVTEVTSEFSEGRFTQKITGLKINHLNYIDEALNQ